VDLVKEFTVLRERFAFGRFIDGGEVTEGRWQFAGRDEFGIGRSRGEMLLVFKATTTKYAMKFKGVKCGAMFSRTRSVSWGYWRKFVGVMMDFGKYFV
jgi:hypothetical protein